MTEGPVDRWTGQLLERVGVDKYEVSLRCDDLAEICRARMVSPAELLER